MISKNLYDDYGILGMIDKYSKDGVLQWSSSLTSSFYTEVSLVLQNSFYGTYYAFITDTLYELSDSGVFIWQSEDWTQ